MFEMGGDVLLKADPVVSSNFYYSSTKINKFLFRS